MTHAESALGPTIFIGVKEICVNCLMEIISEDPSTRWVHTASNSVDCHPLIADLSMVLLP